MCSEAWASFKTSFHYHFHFHFSTFFNKLKSRPWEEVYHAEDLPFTLISNLTDKNISGKPWGEPGQAVNLPRQPGKVREVYNLRWHNPGSVYIQWFISLNTIILPGWQPTQAGSWIGSRLSPIENIVIFIWWGLCHFSDQECLCSPSSRHVNCQGPGWL